LASPLIDINNGFLNRDLDEDVYMQQKPGFSSPDTTLVCKLHKALYGLKQAPQSWFLKLSNTLIYMNFHISKSDSSLFLRFTTEGTSIILIYVDDILVTCITFILIQCFIEQLSDLFALKNLGKLHYFMALKYPSRLMALCICHKLSTSIISFDVPRCRIQISNQHQRCPLRVNH